MFEYTQSCKNPPDGSNWAGCNEEDNNDGDVLETGLVGPEYSTGHDDVLPSGDHHEADEDGARREHESKLAVDKVTKMLEPTLNILGDWVLSVEGPKDGRRAVMHGFVYFSSKNSCMAAQGIFGMF